MNNTMLLSASNSNVLLSSSDKKSLYSIVKGVYLLSHIVRISPPPELAELSHYLSLADKNPELWRNYGSILSQDSLRELTFLCLNEGAFTHQMLSRKISQPKPTLYRNLNTLCEFGIIKASMPLKNHMGRPVVVYQTPDVEPEKIAEVSELHKRLTNSNYIYATRTYQTILDKYPSITTQGQTSKRELLDYMKTMNIANRLNIIDLVIAEFIRGGIKVWR